MRIRLESLYSRSELHDEDEALGMAVMDAGASILDDAFEVGSLAADTLPELLSPMGGTPVIEAFASHATAAQRRIVAGKMAAFDEGRIVVLAGTVLLDGHHHVVAAHRLQKPVRFIDLEDPVAEPDGPEV